jgi:glycosyltransferase involved in cell wall biosynthesis
VNATKAAEMGYKNQAINSFLMRLAIVNPFIETRGGLDYTIMKIAQHTGATVYCSRYNPKTTFPEFRGIDVQMLPGAKGRFIGGVASGLSFYTAKLQDFDLVNCHSSPSEWIRNRNSPVLWYCHSPNREAYDLYDWRMGRRNPAAKLAWGAAIAGFRQIESRVVPHIEHIFANSKNTQKRIRKYLNQESEVLHPAVELSDFSEGDYGKYFLYPSRIAPEKNFEFAIAAFKKFRRMAGKSASGWKLIIAGSLSSRPEHIAYCQEIAEYLGADGTVHTNISAQKRRLLYSNCRALVYTPINEDFGLVPLEGFASSKPCIAVASGGPLETVSDKRDGFLVPDEKHAAIAMLLLSHDASLAERMGKSGYVKVRDKFSWKTFFDRFDAVAANLVKRNAQGK